MSRKPMNEADAVLLVRLITLNMDSGPNCLEVHSGYGAAAKRLAETGLVEFIPGRPRIRWPLLRLRVEPWVACRAMLKGLEQLREENAR